MRRVYLFYTSNHILMLVIALLINLTFLSALLFTLGLRHLFLIRLPFSITVYPTESRHIPLSYTSCKYISITASQSSQNMFPADIYFLSEKSISTYSVPDLKFNEVLEIAPRSYKYYSLFMLAGSSVNLSIETDIFTGIEFHIMTSSQFNSINDNSHEYKVQCIYRCDVTYIFRHSNEYYLLFYNPSNVTVALEFIIQLGKLLHHINTITICEHCILNGDERPCTLRIPASDVSFLYLVTGNTSYLATWDSYEKISIHCPTALDVKSITLIVIGSIILIPVIEFGLLVSCLLCRKWSIVRFDKQALILDRKHFEYDVANQKYAYSYESCRKPVKKKFKKLRLTRKSSIPVPLHAPKTLPLINSPIYNNTKIQPKVQSPLLNMYFPQVNLYNSDLSNSGNAVGNFDLPVHSPVHSDVLQPAVVYTPIHSDALHPLPELSVNSDAHPFDFSTYDEESLSFTSGSSVSSEESLSLEPNSFAIDGESLLTPSLPVCNEKFLPNTAGIDLPNTAGIDLPNTAGIDFPNTAGIDLLNTAGIDLSSSEEEINSSDACAIDTKTEISKVHFNRAKKKVFNWKRSISVSTSSSCDLESSRKRNFSLRRLAMSKLFRKNNSLFT